MSGYASKREVREVTEATLRMEGRDPADYNLTGIMRDAFYDRGRGYGYGALSAETWDAAVVRHRKRGTAEAAAGAEGGTVVAETVNCQIMLTGYGFYARCTRCPWVSEYTPARHRARQYAETHDND